MDALSPLPAAAALVVALGSVFFLRRWVKVPPVSGRYASLDGLRGYLAFFVFLHHSSIWYFYLKSGTWKLPESKLYTHFGQSSVALFFMISGFLFYSKVLEGRKRPINWTRLYLSRVLRLGPLYYFAMAIFLFIVFFLSDFTLHEAPLVLVKNLLRWGSFTLLGDPALNGLQETATILAGVTWSLRYEWLFYFSLPVLAFTARVSVPWPYLLLSGAVVAVAACAMHPSLVHLGSFSGGIAASFLVRSSEFRSRAASPSASLLALASLAVVVCCYKTTYSFVPIALLSVAFIIIACGNTLFGVLSHPLSRLLGELTYGIYLLQGLLLFVTFKFIIGFRVAASFSPLEHWLVILCCTPVLILICFFTFRAIESPAMATLHDVHSWVQRRVLRQMAIPKGEGAPILGKADAA